MDVIESSTIIQLIAAINGTCDTIGFGIAVIINNQNGALLMGLLLLLMAKFTRVVDTCMINVIVGVAATR